MKKILSLILIVSLLIGLSFADNNSAKAVRKGKINTYFEMGSQTTAVERKLEKFAVVGIKEIGAVYGINNDWAVGASWQFLDNLAYPYVKDDEISYAGPLTIIVEKALGKMDLGSLEKVDFKAVFEYDLLPFKTNISKKITGTEDATWQSKGLMASLKGSKTFKNGFTAGGSLFVANSTLEDDPDYETTADKSANTWGYTLGADYNITDDLKGYLTLGHSFDSSAVKKGGLDKDESGMLLLGVSMLF